ncbi:YceI family protein [Shewanella sp. OMA3-2]|uniref:YceI family protein n=1 Tax=Shewanella sp. OMA3-2 TaxID=2908650 RepID=UPI001F44AD5E|nr:YceI family protein [Shewanella sp. OMA3-2]UJF21574.1 YceI family protein [Shewanella sp. OMA3-2]
MKNLTHQYFRIIFISLSLIGLSGCISWVTPAVTPQLTELPAGEYTLDPNHAALVFKIQHLGLSTYVGRFNQFDAKLSFAPNNMQAAQLEATVQIDSLDINNQKLEKTLQNSNWFDSKQFPQAYFKSQKVTAVSSIKTSLTKAGAEVDPNEALNSNQFEFYGLLTLHGITQPVTFNATFHGGADNWMTGKYTLGFSAIGTIKRSDFGISSYIPIVGDEIQLEIYAEFLK